MGPDTDAETPVVVFDFDGEPFYVERVCPKCRRFIGAESILVAGNTFTAEVTNVSAECKKCGTVEPYHWFE